MATPDFPSEKYIAASAFYWVRYPMGREAFEEAMFIMALESLKNGR